MYETNAAVIGTVITAPNLRKTANGEEMLVFRMASNARRLDRASGEWVENGTLYLSVTCWRKLAQSARDSIQRGDPIFAYGTLRTNEYQTKDGVSRTDLEMRASSIGPDLARCSVRRERAPLTVAARPEPVPQPEPVAA